VEASFWGVRGSIPSPGPHTAKVGGNTSCVSVRIDGAPTLVFDLGTGSRGLGVELLQRGEREVVVFLSHLHADHVFGLPFFAPVYTPGFKVVIHVPAFHDDEAASRLSRYLNGVNHPVRMRDLPADIVCKAIRPGHTVQVGWASVEAFRLHHPGGALGYAVTAGEQKLGYLTDSGPFAQPGEGFMEGEAPTRREQEVVDALQGADALIFDAMFDHAEYLQKMTWGHAYPEYGLALCRAAQIRQLFFFHHAPDASDASLEERVGRYQGDEHVTVALAREGLSFRCAQGVV